MMVNTQRNWAGNYTYNATNWHYPNTIEEVRKIVGHAMKVKALGSRHSFNGIADSSGEIISLERLDRRIEIDREQHTVTVDGGVRYGQFSEPLHRAGYALHNLASLPHISVAGACSTATHGSGDANGNLATSVSAIEFVTAGGDLVALSRDLPDDDFYGAVVGLGGLGVITSLTLDAVPKFTMRQHVFEDLPLAGVEDNFDSIMSSAYSVSLFTDWQSDLINQVWLKQAIAGDATPQARDDFYGGTPARAHRHPIQHLSPEPCTEQMGISGPWYERLPHFRMGFTPSSGDELQTEYLVPRERAVDSMRAISSLRDRIAPLLQVSEIRTVVADRLWMSPCFEQACIGIHFTWKKEWTAVRGLLPLIEAALEPFGARPHWGKLFTMEPQRVQSLYPKLADFQQLLRSYDPQGKFRNRFLDRYIF